MNVFNIKVKLENINKSYDLCLNDIETITDQLEKFLSSIKVEGEKKVLHLFNLNNGITVRFLNSEIILKIIFLIYD